MLTSTLLNLLLVVAPVPDGGVDPGSGTSSADPSGLLHARATSSVASDGAREAAIARHPEVRRFDAAEARLADDTERVKTDKDALKQAVEELNKLALPGSSRGGLRLEDAYKAAVKKVELLKAELDAAEAALETATKVWEGSANERAVARGRAGREYDVRRYFTSNTHSQPFAPAEALLQVIGQVVVEKAVESGWQLLSKRLTELAGCKPPGSGPDAKAAASGEPTVTPVKGDAAKEAAVKEDTAEDDAAKDDAGKKASVEESPNFENTCTALSGDIHDLIAQPEMLVRAVVMDVLHMIPDDADIFDAFSVDWKALRAAWRADGATGVRSYLTFAFQDAVIKVYRDHETCPKHKSVPTIAAWMIGNCAADTACDVSAVAQACVPTESRSLVISVVSLSAGGKEPRDAVNTLFELARLGPRGESPYLEHLQGLVVGLLDRDTNRAMTAAADMAVYVFTNAVEQRKAEEAESKPKTRSEVKAEEKVQAARAKRDKNIRKFFEVMAGAARYAAAKGTEAEKMAARKDVVKELITRMTRRGNRNSGWVVSLGGSFGVVGGARMSAGGTANFGYASPMHVGLGLGLDSYHSRQRGGLHFELSVLDLGQYVVFTNRTLSVEKPDIKAAIAPSLKLGGHFALKETPMYLAGFLGLSPFVHEKQTTQEHMTVSWGLIFGVYVPFIDFN